MPTPAPQAHSRNRYTFGSGARPLDGYTIKRAIGRGGFGEVYYATSDSGKEVALKLILRNLEVECRGVVQCMNLKCPNLLTIFDLKTNDGGDTFVVMEYVAGPSLASVLAQHPAGMPLDEVSAWLRGLVEGVAYLHDHGIVHRDLKPANLFMEEGIVKIGDYGLAKLITPSQGTEHSESIGTCHYMAPEISSGKYHRPIDVYAVGVILYEMLTGRVPFDGETVGEILMKHLTAQPDLSKLSEPYRTIVGRALAKDPAQRPGRLHDLLAPGDAAPESSALAAGCAPPATVVESPQRSYTLVRLLAAGDVSDVHLGESEGKAYVVKISRIAGGARLLETESRVVTEILRNAGSTNYNCYFPTLSESFPVRDTFPKRVNVFLSEPGFYSLEDVHARHPSLDGRHLVWIFKRLLTALGFAHRLGWIHGAVCPPHIRIHAENHGLQLVGWGQAVPLGGNISSGPAKYLSWYPAEVTQKRGVHPATDIYMAARSMVDLAGGAVTGGQVQFPTGVPVEMVRFFRSCLLEGPSMRPGDCWSLHDEFDEIVRGLYGAPKFVPLVMT